MRQLIASLGAPGLFFTEMLSARHIPQDISKGSLWLQRAECERPMAYQIFASTPEEAALGTRGLLALDPEIVDLNLACPAPNIARKRKSGAHLLNDLPLTARILKAMKGELDRPLTAKIRLGKRPDLIFLREIGAMLESCGVAAVTLHPRLTGEKLKRRARWEYIAHLKDAINIPVIGNGDVKTPADCLKMFQETGCDGVMIGRAAIQRPWIFAEICGRHIEVDLDFLRSVYLKGLELICSFFPETMALGRLKEFTWYFSRNLKFGHPFAARLQGKKSLKECRAYIKDNFPKTV